MSWIVPAVLESWHSWMSDPWLSVLSTLTAILAGMVVGFDREAKKKPAGIRTMSIVALGACAMTIVSRKIAEQGGGDPTRIAAQIVSGVGFLGAGAIIQSRSGVRGLTTSATIWGVAAVGMVCGAGYIGPGVGLAGLIRGSIFLTDFVEMAYAGPCKTNAYRLLFRDDDGKTRIFAEEILEEHNILAGQRQYFLTDSDLMQLEFVCCIKHKAHRSLLGELARIPGVHSLKPSER